MEVTCTKKRSNMGSNVSDHFPIECHVLIQHQKSVSVDVADSDTNSYKIRWDKTDVDM